MSDIRTRLTDALRGQLHGNVAAIVDCEALADTLMELPGIAIRDYREMFGLYACSTCWSVVKEEDRQLHDAWHYNTAYPASSDE
jgi:hypothetical protein